MAIFDNGLLAYMPTVPCGPPPDDCLLGSKPIKPPDVRIGSQNEVRFQLRVREVPFTSWSSIATMKWN
eukprot:621012-Prymnesium_polylepis.1